MRRRINLLLLAIGIVILSNKLKCKCHMVEEDGVIYLLSGETLIIAHPEESTPVNQKIQHLGFAPDDYRQEIVAEAYQLWGLDFISLIECENDQWLTGAVGDWGKAYGLCQLNTRRHKEPLAPEWKDWRNQLSICYSKRKWGTKFYWPQRLIWGKRCWKVAKKRFMVAEDFTLVD